MKTNNVKRVLELGAGHGRDTIFFASNDFEVQALDYSAVAINILNSTIYCFPMERSGGDYIYSKAKMSRDRNLRGKRKC
jgi:cyclopropane fatty-acyl-phospholipid synthase-like methyltransferase